MSYEENWNKWYMRLIDYLERYDIKTITKSTIHKGENLGTWVRTQREAYEGKNNRKISEEHIKLLDQVGFIWNVKHYDDIWNEWYSILEDYLTQYKFEEIKQGTIYKNKRLGRWVKRQIEVKNNDNLSIEKIEILNKLNFIWSKSDYNWYQNYNILLDYLKNNTIEDITTSLVYKGCNLGSWVQTQRKAYHNLGNYKISQHQIDLLEDINFLWKVSSNNYYEKQKENKWRDMYKILNKYYLENDNFDINIYEEYEGTKLGYWVYDQRKNYCSNNKEMLCENKIKLLDEINFNWDEVNKDNYLISYNKYDGKWKEWYKVLIEYLETYNMENINKRTIYKGKNLGYWIYYQIYLYNNNKLHIYKFKKLDKLNFIWSKSDYSWYKNYNILLEYLKNNNIEDITSKTTYKNNNIGYWINKQKRAYYSEDDIVLSPHKIELLNKIDITLLNKITEKYNKTNKKEADKVKYKRWSTMYNLLKGYYKKYNTFKINRDEKYRKQDIGKWVYNQRYYYFNSNTSKLTTDRIKLLNDINFDWDEENSSIYKNSYRGDEEVWKKWYELLCDYKQEFGHLDIRFDTIYKDKKLGYWVFSQRKFYKENDYKHLSIQHIELLNNIDFDWISKRNDLSFPQICIFFYLKKYLNEYVEISNRDIIDSKEIDILVNYKDELYGIEYDGEYFHKDIDKDIEKDIMCISKNIKLIRVRELNCPKLINSSYIIYLVDKKKVATLENVIRLILVEQFKYIGELQINITKDYPKIISLYNKIISEKWMEWYNLLLEYKDEFGNFIISQTQEYKGKKLGIWISNIRTAYKGKNEIHLTKEQIKLLSDIGFSFNPREDSWLKTFDLVLEYIQAYECIPKRRTTYKGINIGEWYHSQKRNLINMKNKATKEIRINMLRKVGINISREESL